MRVCVRASVVAASHQANSRAALSQDGALPRANPHPEPDEHQGAGDKQQVDCEPVENAFVSSLRHGVTSSLRSLRRRNEGGCERIHKTGLVHPVVSVPLLGWLNVMDYDRSDKVLLAGATMAVAFLLYVLFGPN
jgi:hypothetical protein